MKVTFLQSGGFAGLVRGCELDTASMNPEEGRRLRSLVGRCPASAPGEDSAGEARDTVRYEITVEESGALRSLRFDEPSIPERAEELIAFLEGRSAPRRP